MDQIIDRAGFISSIINGIDFICCNTTVMSHITAKDEDYWDGFQH